MCAQGCDRFIEYSRRVRTIAMFKLSVILPYDMAMKSTVSPHVVGDDVGDAYARALNSRLENEYPHRYRTIHISDPIGTFDSTPHSVQWDHWQDVVNAGDVLGSFESYEFSDGSTGRFWVQDRIDELFSGIYATRLTDGGNQVEQITTRLQKGNHGQTTNALVAQVFRIEPDLRHATHGRPLAPDMACLTQLQFRPSKNKLNLYATFRSQYFDTKCYGNLISLAILLAAVCDRTDYEPGYLLETAYNTTFRDREDAENLDTLLREANE